MEAFNRKEETRFRLLASGARLAKSNGFEITGIDAFMAEIGMAGGTFYGHFSSKEEFLHELLRIELRKTIQLLGGSEAELSKSGLETRIRNYLTTDHANSPSQGCVLAALSSEIGRADRSVRSLVRLAVSDIHSKWAGILGSDDHAWALLAAIVGAISLARSLDLQTTRIELLEGTASALVQALIR